MQNLVAALNSSIQFNKKNFWIDPITHNQYYVGVQYPEADIQSIETLLDVPITSPVAEEADPAAQHGLGAARQGAGRGHAHRLAADHRPDDGRPRPRPRPRRRRRVRRARPLRQPVQDKMFWGLWTPTRAASGRRSIPIRESKTCCPAAGSRSAASIPACRTPSSTSASA